MLRTNFKIAVRKLLNKREFTLINVLGLSVGLTTSLLIFLWVNDEINFDKFHKGSDRVYGVWAHDYRDNGDIATESRQNGLIKNVMDSDFPEVERSTRVDSREHQLAVGDRKFKQLGIMVDEEFFQMFNFPFIEGELEENSLATYGDVILTESMAIKLFDKTNVVGELIKIDNTRDGIIRGVVKDPPKNSQFQFDFVLSIENWTKRNSWIMRWGNSGIFTFIQLKENASPLALETKIEDLIRKNQEGNTKSLFLKSFDDIYLRSSYEGGEEAGGRIEYVRLFTLIGIFIVFIACINFINLSVADAFKRAKEVGVRKVSGANRLILIKQFLTESSLIVVLSVVIAVIFIEIALGPFNTLTGKEVSLNWLDTNLLGLVGGLGIFTVLVSGLYPALVLSSFNVVKALKGKVDAKGTSRAGGYFRKGLVVFQFVIAGFLIFATLIINGQVEYIFENQRNVDKEGVIMLQNDGALLERYESFRSELLKDPSIQSVTVVGHAPVNVEASTGDFDWEGKDPLRDKTSFNVLFTEQDFVPTMNLKIVAGRNFSREIESDVSTVLVNEATVRGMNVENPVGMAVKFWDNDVKIIGVVEDFHTGSVYDEIEPLIILNYAENSDYVTIKAARGQEQRAVEVLKEKYEAFMPGYLFDYKFLSEEHEAMYKSELLIKDLAKVFGLIAIVISCLGLYGLTSINAQRGVKEIGVRKVLGASVWQILLGFSRQSLSLPVLALVLMVPLAYYTMDSWLQDFQYHIDIMPSSLAGVVVASLLIAWLTVSIIAYKAAKTNPVNSLRNE
ncbi:hypothetical protein BFP97_04385 [Roseivirga sp. 4D4]|uniref:ABC transporter permease n=1 Tax=Roseivirga sp. 4D4 TaxID=1889784 RepID=UPI0008538F17|nr:ABC transporter permease [Roseivirga sp. 4D4]OEK00791.1 hypothetical protein BFP97_04385 [Roseivirga sp. 4D4]